MVRIKGRYPPFSFRIFIGSYSPGTQFRKAGNNIDFISNHWYYAVITIMNNT